MVDELQVGLSNGLPEAEADAWSRRDADSWLRSVRRPADCPAVIADAEADASDDGVGVSRRRFRSDERGFDPNSSRCDGRRVGPGLGTNS